MPFWITQVALIVRAEPHLPLQNLIGPSHDLCFRITGDTGVGLCSQLLIR